MLNLKRFLKGDTLIEVTIAIGIFTLVAVSVVAVVNISTSGAQSALENTLTREEVDTQAEAIRFLQSIYNPDLLEEQVTPNTKEDLYQALWQRLRSLAEANSKYGLDESLSSFDSGTCSVAYENNNDLLKSQNAFIIDLKKLNSYVEGDDVSQFVKDVIITAKDHPELFMPATTYPQLVYTKSTGSNDSSDPLLIDDYRGRILSSVEGVYIVGMLDANKTNVVYQDTSGNESVMVKSAYADFFVRSCWYNSGSENSSAVSTAVRVRDPEAISYIEPTPETRPSGPTEPEITFENIEWQKYGDTKYNACGMSYCGSSGPSLFPSHWSPQNGWETNCEPSAGQHVVYPNDTSITLIGSTESSVSLGAYYDKFSVSEAFSLEVHINAKNVGAHPTTGGSDGLTIKLSIVDGSGGMLSQGVNASIGTSSGLVEIPGTSEKFTTTSKEYDLVLEYNHGRFSACVTEPGKAQQCISATKQVQAGSFLKVDYNLKHSSHCCSEIAVIKLSNISMRRAASGSISF